MEMINLPTGSLTMTSREIAERTGKEHKNVLADIRSMLEGIGLTSAEFSADLPDSYGRMQPGFKLPKRECLILVSGYSVELRAAVIDRWQELEAQQARPDPMVVLNDPAAMRGILLTYAEKVITLEAENKELGVKAGALDRIATADGSLCITDAAKALQIRPKDLFDYLKSHGWIYKRAGNAHYLGYQSKVATGLLEHKVETVLRADGSEKITEQVRITPKGLAALAKLFPPPVELAA